MQGQEDWTINQQEGFDHNKHHQHGKNTFELNTAALYAMAKPSSRPSWWSTFQPKWLKTPERASAQKLEISWKQMTSAAWSFKEGAKRFQQNESTKLDNGASTRC